jgi:1,4-alpha-glucan branching enzyme
MGWMNDMLSYMEMDPIYRQYHHSKLTFSLTYAFSEYYVLPFSHDEVVHGKKSMLNKMPGTYEEKFQQLRLLYTYQMAHPGKKLTFMGMELGTFIEWRFYESLEWFLLAYPTHDEFRRFVRGLNRFYRDNPALYERDDGWDGFEWSVVDDKDTSVVAFLRKSQGETLLCVFNFTPIARPGYTLPVPEKGRFEPVFSTSEQPPAQNKALIAKPAIPGLRFPYMIETDLFPFCGMYYKFTKKNDGKDVTQG